MPFYQNPFSQEFRGNLLLGNDKTFSLTFVVPRNAGRGDNIVCSWHLGPYNLSGTDADGDNLKNLTINYFLHDTKAWNTLTIDLTAGVVSAAAVTNSEIVSILNSNAIFKDRFIAELNNYKNSQEVKITIRQRDPVTKFGFYIVNGGADTVIGFNARAGVAEAPSYFSRHTIDSRYDFEDGLNMLVELDPDTSDVQADIIDDAVDAKGVSLGYSSSDVSEDWELLRGRGCGAYTFTKQTLDGSNRVTEKIEYGAGAVEGDLARKTFYTYSGAVTTPIEIMEVPYVLQSSDLITP